VPSVVRLFASTFSSVHRATIFCVPGFVASGFIAVKALNCGFSWFASEGLGFIVAVCFFLLFKSLTSKLSRNKSLQHHSGASRLRWTVFKSRLCDFAAQKYSTKPQLKNCR